MGSVGRRGLGVHPFEHKSKNAIEDPISIDAVSTACNSISDPGQDRGLSAMCVAPTNSAGGDPQNPDTLP